MDQNDSRKFIGVSLRQSQFPRDSYGSAVSISRQELLVVYGYRGKRVNLDSTKSLRRGGCWTENNKEHGDGRCPRQARSHGYLPKKNATINLSQTGGQFGTHIAGTLVADR